MRIPSLRKHKASGLAVVTIRGRDRYLGRFGTQQAVAGYERLLREHYGPTTVRSARDLGNADDLTIKELTAAYRLHIREAYGESSRCMIRSALRSAEELFGNELVADFGPLGLEEVREAFVERGLCRSTVNRYTHAVKVAFRWGVARELVHPDVWKRLDAVQGLRKGRSRAPERPRKRPVPDHHVRATLPHLHRILGEMVRIQRGVGSRPGELTAMRPCEVDTDGIVAVNGARFWVWCPGAHKNDWREQNLSYLIPPDLQPTLQSFLDRDPGAFCFSPREGEEERLAERREHRTTPLYRSHLHRQKLRKRSRRRRKLGVRYTTASYRKAVERACEAAGVPRWTPHQLRHSRATELTAKVGIENSRRALGHQSIRTTELYSAMDLRGLAEALAGLGSQ